MHRQPTVFAQLLKVLPFDHFEHLVDKYQANRYSKTLPAWAHLVSMVYAQLTRREGLRDLVACLNSRASQLYHLGIRHRLSRSTLADAAQRRDCQLFEALGQRLISMALTQHQDDAIPLGLKEPLYAMDSTTISLCLNLFTWAYFRSSKAAVKAHTVLDLRGTIPVFIAITTGDIPDNKLLDAIALPAHATVVLDRGYVDFTRLYTLAKNKLRFVVRAKDNLHYRRVQSRRVDESTGLRTDDTIWLVNKKSRRAYPRRLRRIEFYDEVNHVTLVLLTNRFDLSALTIAQIYKERWKIELFFKWLKQNLTLKHFFGNSENAVRSQIWIAICVYLIVLIAHKQLKLDISLQLLLHLIEANIFEHISLHDLVVSAQSLEPEWPENTQMPLL